MEILSGPKSGGDAEAVTESVRRHMESQWREPGFTCPNADTYPWLWLWDSCFHSLIWASLGDEGRAVTELRSALSHQHPSGFVPHVVYFDGFKGHRDFWGAEATSSITQPPIYGHTVAALTRMGVTVPHDLVEQARRGLDFLLNRRRRTEGGLVQMVHPWESGCDHSPRWDDLFVASDRDTDRYDHDIWFRRKGEMVESIVRVDGAPVASSEFTVGSVAFNALIAFCAHELADVSADALMKERAVELSGRLSDRWNRQRCTWVDEGSTEHGSGAVRTLEGLLPILVEPSADLVDAARRMIVDRSAFAGRFGLRQVHPDEPSFDPSAYWRGPSWPQLNYLVEVALRRRGLAGAADDLAAASRSGAVGSGYSEYWNADDGTGGGARPQTWSGLIVVDTRISARS